MHRLRKVYIQDRNVEKIKDIITSLKGPTPYYDPKNAIITTTNTDQFVIPYELDM
jgi:hypothetical protein